MTDPEDPDVELVERLLVAARPVPDEAFVSHTERRLLGRSRASSSWHMVRPALAISGAFAVVVVIASLAGAGPLSTGGTEDVRARQDCTVTTVTRTQPVGTIVQGSDGEPTIVRRDGEVTRDDRRCR